MVRKGKRHTSKAVSGLCCDLNDRGYEWSREIQDLALDRVCWRSNVVKGSSI